MIRIISWNIQHGGGQRAAGICRCLDGWTPDCVVLSEFRGTGPSQRIAAHLYATGLDHQVSSVDLEHPTRNTLIIASKFPLTPIENSEVLPEFGRWLPVDVASENPFSLIGMHVPNRGSGRKWAFHDAVVREFEEFSERMGLAVGDTNTGRQGLDEETSFFSGQEDSWFDRIADAGWSDVYRDRYPSERTFSWYSTHRNGFRLDQAFATATMDRRIRTIRYDWGEPESPSDHAAIILDVE